MKISDIGEFGLIARCARLFPLDASVIAGSGDDCAVLKFNKGQYMLATCDMIIEGKDFTRRDSPYLVGRKALAVSLSDIAACAGIPSYALVSLALPKDTRLEFAQGLCKGMADLAKKYKVNIVGGDLSAADKIVIDTSLIGFVEKNRLVLRSGAKKGDIIFTSGALGGSIRGKHLRFSPRLKEARYLAKNFQLGAMIDISDGLAGDLGRIMEQSAVGAVIYEELIPLSRKAKNLTDALYAGEDFELLFTAPRKVAAKIIAKRLKFAYPIGEIAEKKQGLRLIDRHNRERHIKPLAFRHF